MSINPIKSNNRFISFKAGKTFVYTDFDNTYTPFSHDEMISGSISKDSQKKERFNNYFNQFKNLKENAQDKLDLTITTGRSFQEYAFVENSLKKQNLDYFSPQSLITFDGVGGFVKNKDDKWIKDEKKYNYIKEKNPKWNVAAIKNNLKQLFSKVVKNPLFLEAEVNRCYSDYPGISIEDNAKQYDLKSLENYISFNKINDDNVVDVAFSKKLPPDNLKQTINEYFRRSNIDTNVIFCVNDKYAYLPQYNNNEVSYEPSNRVFIKPNINNTPFSKLTDVKEKVKEIITNNSNDLVIVAGDEFNDEAMLNPLNYVDLIGVRFDKKKSLKENLENKDVLSAIQNLPIKIIVVGSSPNLDNIREMKDILQKKGINKIDAIKSSDDSKKNLINSIEKAIYDYSESNDEFSYNMGLDLFKYLLTRQVVYS